MEIQGSESLILTSFEDEEPLKFVWWRKKDGKLDSEEDEVADHLLGRDPNTLWNMVWDIEKRRPDSTYHLSHGSRTSVRLNCVPEQSCNHTDNDSEA